MFGGDSAITFSELLTEVQMTRQVFKGTIILTEGGTDLKRFQSFFQKGSFEIVVCWNKDNALKIADELSKIGETKFVALVDADFDRIMGTLSENEHVVYSDSHDFDSDVFNSDALDAYIFQITGDVSGKYVIKVRSDVMCRVRKLSHTRYLNIDRKWYLPMSEVNLERCIQDMSISIPRFISKAYQLKKDPTRDLQSIVQELSEYLEYVELARKNQDSNDQLDNGHDLSFALGLVLRSEPFGRSKANCLSSEVEMHLRMCFGKQNIEMKSFWARLVSLDRRYTLGII